MRISRLRSAGLLTDLGLGLSDQLGDLGNKLALDAADDLDAGFLLGERGDPLELSRDECPLVLDGLAQRLELRFATGQPLLVRIQLAEPALEPLLALVGSLLQPCDLRAALANLRLGLVATSRRLFLRGEEHRLGFLFGRPDLLEAAFGISVVRDDGFAPRFCARTQVLQPQTRPQQSLALPGRGSRCRWDGTSEVGRDAPCLDCLTSGKGPGRDPQRLDDPVGAGPLLAGRSRRETIPLYEPKGLLACFDQCHVAGLP